MTNQLLGFGFVRQEMMLSHLVLFQQKERGFHTDFGFFIPWLYISETQIFRMKMNIYFHYVLPHKQLQYKRQSIF